MAHRGPKQKHDEGFLDGAAVEIELSVPEVQFAMEPESRDSVQRKAEAVVRVEFG
jgi:hypothetical protein